MEKHILNIILSGAVLWSAAFLLIRKLLLSRSFEFCRRLVSTIHAILAVILTTLSIEDWSHPLASKSSPTQWETPSVSVSFFVYDLICSLFDRNFNLDVVIHHLVVIVGICAGHSYQKCGSEMIAALWLTELSGPFLHLRELLKELGYRDTNLNMATDISYTVIFSSARMVGGPYLAYVTLTATNPFIIKAMALGLQVVSAFWFYKIVRMMKYKLSKRTYRKGYEHNGKLN